MKNFYFTAKILLLSLAFFSLQAQAQAPQTITYQSVIRNSSNALLANTAVGIKISILQGSATGTEAYAETQTATTNTNGLVSLQIGTGTPTTGTTFAGIDWAAGPYFIKTETDPTGGSNYTITGIQQMASVPYALYAAKSGGTVFEPTIDIPDAIHNTNQGNVGIGTDLPGEKLDVAGNLKVRQNAFIEGASIANSFVKAGGQANEFLMADGSTSAGQVDVITAMQAQINALYEKVVFLTPIQTNTIGSQDWTTTNLSLAFYSDGTLIPQVTDPTAWANLTTGAWCYYNNDPATGATYGKLYNWYAVSGIWNEASKTDTSQRKKLAPTGYHVPSVYEWGTLYGDLGGQQIAGGKMKETDTTHWTSPNTDATNSSGFTALPGGHRDNDGSFILLGSNGYWWTSNDVSTSMADFRYLNNDDGIARGNVYFKTAGFSVRCVKD